MTDSNVKFFKASSFNNVDIVDNTGVILKLDGGIYLGNETNSPELIANKILKVSELENDSNFVSESELSAVATSGSYNDLSNKPNIPSVDGLATKEYVDQEISKMQNSSYDDTEIKNQLANKADKTELFSKSYNDLTDKPTIPSVDGLASEEFVREEIEAIDYVTAVDTVEEVDGVSNDFITSEQLDARDYATTTSINQQISTLENEDNSLSSRITKLENNSIIDTRASVL